MEETSDKNLENKMWNITHELKNRKNMQSWKKMGFFKDWLKSILEIADDEDTKKPTEPTITFLAETNVYLTRKLKELEQNPTQAVQPQVHDPNTQATPMVASTQPTWAYVVAAPDKPTQNATKKPATLVY